jgi:DNA-binding GntR family transcriptional regulator
MYDQYDVPTDIGQIVYRGDRYRFRTTLQRRSP